jgi:hypothetical protein
LRDQVGDLTTYLLINKSFQHFHKGVNFGHLRKTQKNLNLNLSFFQKNQGRRLPRLGIFLHTVTRGPWWLLSQNRAKDPRPSSSAPLSLHIVPPSSFPLLVTQSPSLLIFIFPVHSLSSPNHSHYPLHTNLPLDRPSLLSSSQPPAVAASAHN